MKGYTNAQGLFDPGHALVTSYAFPSEILGTIRLVLALYITFTTIFTWVWDAQLTGSTNQPQAYVPFVTTFDHRASLITNMGPAVIFPTSHICRGSV